MAFTFNNDPAAETARAAETAGASRARRENVSHTLDQQHQSSMQAAAIAANQDAQAFNAQRQAEQNLFNAHADQLARDDANQQRLQDWQMRADLQQRDHQWQVEQDAQQQHFAMVQDGLKNGWLDWDARDVQRMNELATGIRSVDMDNTLPDDVRAGMRERLVGEYNRIYQSPKFKAQKPQPAYHEELQAKSAIFDPSTGQYLPPGQPAPKGSFIVTPDRSGAARFTPAHKAEPQQGPQNPAEYLLSPERAGQTFAQRGEQMYRERETAYRNDLAAAEARLDAAKASLDAVDTRDSDFMAKRAAAAAEVAKHSKALVSIREKAPGYPSQEEIKRQVYSDFDSWSRPVEHPTPVVDALSYVGRRFGAMRDYAERNPIEQVAEVERPQQPAAIEPVAASVHSVATEPAPKPNPNPRREINGIAVQPGPDITPEQTANMIRALERIANLPPEKITSSERHAAGLFRRLLGIEEK